MKKRLLQKLSKSNEVSTRDAHPSTKAPPSHTTGLHIEATMKDVILTESNGRDYFLGHFLWSPMWLGFTQKRKTQPQDELPAEQYKAPFLGIA